MIDIDNVKTICFNLEKQHNQISETYNELINSLKLESKVNELNKVIDDNNLQINHLTDVVEGYKVELEDKNEVITKLNDVIYSNKKEIENKNKEIVQLREELNNVKNIGNMILNLHNQQFVKLLNHMDRLIQYTEWNNFDVLRNGYYNGMKGRPYVNTNFNHYYNNYNNTMTNGNNVNKSSLELLVDVNNKFTKLSINVMKLLSHLDHNNIYNITYSNQYNYFNYRNNVPMNYTSIDTKASSTEDVDTKTETQIKEEERQKEVQVNDVKKSDDEDDTP